MKGYKTSELYVIIYVMAVLGARYLGIDFHGIDPSTVEHANQAVQQVAEAYRQATTATGGGTSMAVLAGLYVGARTLLKFTGGEK